MKSRTSFFDQTVLKKDITRFAPLWGLYLIGGLLVAFTSAIGHGHSYYLAENLSACIGPMSIISLCFAALAAQLLFGDLFNTRLCNALHAMPLRREGWFFTHVTAGLLFYLVPNAIISLALMLFLGKFWYASLLWLLGMTLHYLFFFGLAVFCMMLTGNRFASAAVYAIINFFSMLVMWFSSTVFGPLMYGVVIRTEGFAPYSPVVELCSNQKYFLFEHDLSCPCVKNGKVICGAPMGIAKAPANPPVEPTDPQPTDPQPTTPPTTEPTTPDNTGLVIGIVVAAVVVAGAVGFLVLKNKKHA